MADAIAQHSRPARFNSERIFFQSTLDGENTGWYISITDVRAYGPFAEKEVAIYILKGLMKRIKEKQENSQRSVNAA